MLYQKIIYSLLALIYKKVCLIDFVQTQIINVLLFTRKTQRMLEYRYKFKVH